MADLAVMILAAGDQRRWPPNVIKQMLDVGGVTVIERVVHQVRRKWQAEPWVAVKGGQPFGLGMRYHYPADCTHIFDTLQSTIGRWRDVNIILLGDVYYSDACLDAIAEGSRVFYGDGGDIYGLRFTSDEVARLMRAIVAARRYAAVSGNGKLWHVYRAWEHFPMDEHKVGKYFYKLPDGDETQDFDRPEMYETWRRRHP